MVTRIMAAVDAEYTEVTRVRIRRALRRAVLSTVFERIEVHRATIRGYDPDLIRLVWHIPRGEQKPVLSPPSATRAN
ncbi:MAG: hypothetical protein KY450_14595 [Actinobacteria bacterium]|nr:hypothetical protein [Actinomycetota bacterium]